MGIHPKGSKTLYTGDIRCPTLYTSVNHWNQPSGPSAQEWLKTNGIDTQWSVS